MESPNKIPTIPINIVLGIVAVIVLIYLINKIFGLFKSETDDKANKEEQKSVYDTAFDPKFYTGATPTGKKKKKAMLLKQAVVNGIIVGLYYSLHGSMFNDAEEFAKWLYKIRYKTQFSQVADAYEKRYQKNLKLDMESFNNTNYMKFITYIDGLPEGFYE